MSFEAIVVALLCLVAATAYYFTSAAPATKPRRSPPNDDEKENRKKKEEEEKQQQLKIAKANYPKPGAKRKKPPREKPHDPTKRNPTHYVRRFGGHQKTITCAAISPDGTLMATACADGVLRIVTSSPSSSSSISSSSFEEVQVTHKLEAGSDRIRCVGWLNDNRTVACVVGVYNRPDHVALFRIRAKKKAAEGADDDGGKTGVEIVELSKRRFSTSESKFFNVSSICVDATAGASECDLLLLTGTSSLGLASKTTTAYDGRTGSIVGGGSASVPAHGGGELRLSKDAKFFCGRRFHDLDESTGLPTKSRCTEVRVCEVVKKRHKGNVDPQFDSMSSKSVMTLPANRAVVDVDFLLSGDENSNGGVSDRALVCTADGALQVWNIDVEYQRGEDPKMLYESEPQTCLAGKHIVMMTSTISTAVSDDGNSRSHRIAVATADSAIHLFSYHSKNETKKKQQMITHDYTMEECHGPRGIDDLFFGVGGSNNSGEILYSRGTMSKDVFAWNIK